MRLEPRPRNGLQAGKLECNGLAAVRGLGKPPPPPPRAIPGMSSAFQSMRSLIGVLESVQRPSQLVISSSPRS